MNQHGRSYMPGLGRWMSAVMLEKQMQELEHAYTYAENNPINRIDPSGLQSSASPYQMPNIPDFENRNGGCYRSATGLIICPAPLPKQPTLPSRPPVSMWPPAAEYWKSEKQYVCCFLGCAAGFNICEVTAVPWRALFDKGKTSGPVVALGWFVNDQRHKAFKRVMSRPRNLPAAAVKVLIEDHRTWARASSAVGKLGPLATSALIVKCMCQCYTEEK